MSANLGIKKPQQTQQYVQKKIGLKNQSVIQIPSRLQGNKENINTQDSQNQFDESPVLKSNRCLQQKKNEFNNYYISSKSQGGIKLATLQDTNNQCQEDILKELQQSQKGIQSSSINLKNKNSQQNNFSVSSSLINLGSLTSRKVNQDQGLSNQANHGKIKFYNAATTSYQKILSSRCQTKVGIESQSLGSSEMRRILRSSFQKQQDTLQNISKYSCQDSKNLNISQSQLNGSSFVRNSLNITTEVGESTGRTNNRGILDQDQLSHIAYNSKQTALNEQLLQNNFISTEPSPDKEFKNQNQGNFNQDQELEKFTQNIYSPNQKKQKNRHLFQQQLDLNLKKIDDEYAEKQMLNVDEHITLEDSNDNRNYPSSPLLPISVSRIYKNCSLDSRKITQTSQDFSISIQQTQIFYDINLFDFFNDNQFAFKQIISYLDIRSCLNLCCTHNFFRSKRQRRLINKQLKFLMIKGLLPKNMRAKYWVHISRANDFKKTFTPENYRTLSVCEPRCEREIVQDIDRTFPNIKEFKTKEKTYKLQKVLRALSFCLPDMEYCQGLNYVVGSLLLYADEEESFYICVSMLKNYGFKDCYFEDLNGLQQAVKILDNLIKLYFPHVADFLNKKNIQTGLFATSWFNTLFAYDFPRQFFIRVIDLFLFSGWKILFQISLAIIQEAQFLIFTADEDDIVNIIKKGLSMNQEQILLNSQNYKITNRMVVDLSKILTKSPFIKNLNLSYDLKAKKRRWEYEIDDSKTGEEYLVRQATFQRQQMNSLKKQQQEKKKNQKSFLSSIIDALTPQFCCSSDSNVQDYEQEISMKKRDFRNFSTFSSTNLNGSRHFLLPLEDKQSILEQWHGQQQYEPDVNFDLQMIEQQTKQDLNLRNSVKSHPKKFIETIKKSFIDS
ncbi:hypothetical protein ABPG74_012792 [Tetrahymena malaccensis]